MPPSETVAVVTSLVRPPDERLLLILLRRSAVDVGRVSSGWCRFEMLLLRKGARVRADGEEPTPSTGAAPAAHLPPGRPAPPAFRLPPVRLRVPSPSQRPATLLVAIEPQGWRTFSLLGACAPSPVPQPTEPPHFRVSYKISSSSSTVRTVPGSFCCLSAPPANQSGRADVVVSNREELVQALRAGGLSETEAEIEAAQTLAHIQALGLHELDFLAYKKKRDARMRKDGVIEKGREVMVIQADPGGECSRSARSLLSASALTDSAKSAVGLFSTIVPLATAIAGSNGAIILVSSGLDRQKGRRKLTSPSSTARFLAGSFEDPAPRQVDRRARPERVPLRFGLVS